MPRILAEKAGATIEPNDTCRWKKDQCLYKKTSRRRLWENALPAKKERSQTGVNFMVVQSSRSGCKFSMNKKNVLRFLQQFHVPYDDEGQSDYQSRQHQVGLCLLII